MADLAVLQGRLSEAETAYHALMTGRLEVSVGYGDQRVTYNQADKAELRDYIRDLTAQIRAAGGGGARRRPIVVEF